MAKHSESPSTSASSDSVVEQKLLQFAEQLGYVVGTVQGKADGWLDRKALQTQISSVRDAASDLLKHVAGSDLAHAPGKRHRKPAPGLKGVKHSDERIAKLRVADANRQRRKF